MSFRNIVFAGGGNRCFWQAGFWDAVAEPLALRPHIVSTVSAGAAIACMVLADRTGDTLRHFSRVLACNRRNCYPSNLFRGRPMFPHDAIYRGAILEAIDQQALARIHAGPEVLIQIARPPRWLGVHVGGALGVCVYELEKLLFRRIHRRFTRALGFRAIIVSVRACRTPEQLADVILASSCTPPFTPLSYLDGKAVLDGGLIDNTPIGPLASAAGDTLVLLTRPYGKTPSIPGRLYVQPSTPVPVASWDYTNPRGLQAAYDLGRRDGAAFLKHQAADKLTHASPGVDPTPR